MEAEGLTLVCNSVRMMPVIIEDSASVLSVKQTYMKRKDLYYMMTYPSRLFKTSYFKLSGVMIKVKGVLGPQLNNPKKKRSLVFIVTPFD